MLRIRRAVLIGGGVQVAATAALGTGALVLIGMPVAQSLLGGMMLSLSSTAIVLKTLQEKAQMDTPHGRAALAVLIFQDLVAIPMLLVIPLIAGGRIAASESWYIIAAKAAGLILFVIAGTKWLIPKVFFYIARTRSRELFLLTLVLIGLGVAILTSSMGLSLALGAFLAGLMISETEYSHEALGNVLPFRDIFMSFFFVSIGMLLDMRFFMKHPFVILVMAGVLIVLKIATGYTAGRAAKFPPRTSFLLAAALTQVGEFSFILADAGAANKLLSADYYQYFLAAAVLSMAVTPFFISYAPCAWNRLKNIPYLRRYDEINYETVPLELNLCMQNHLVIIGYGINGTNLARAARRSGISYIIIEMNPDTVKRERERGENIIYGDASHHSVLASACIESARVAVVAINDASASRGIAANIKNHNADVHLIVRTRFVSEIEPLKKLGVNEVIPEEFETSVEITTRVLGRYLVPHQNIEKLVSELRDNDYGIFRKPAENTSTMHDLKTQFDTIGVTIFEVSEGSPAANKSLLKLDLRKTFGVTAVAVRRGEKLTSNPDAKHILKAGDHVALIGEKIDIARASAAFKKAETKTDTPRV